jgi:acetylornithine deacetylase/succinyl-diaminopimelate desuccinylase-like protein
VNRRLTAFALFAFAILAPLHCRKADAVDRDPMTAEAEEALVGYVRIDTTNPPGNETSGAKYLAALFAKNGIEARLLGDDPKRQGVYARLSARDDATGEKALLLLNHIDVVPAVPQDWTKPPFSGLQSGGYIWGRGSLDMKSLAIAQLMAMVDLKRRGAVLRRDVIFLAAPDEELGGLKGTYALLQRYPELFRDVGFVLTEGGSNDAAVDKVLYWAIEVQQKVPLWVRLHADGLGGHGAGPPADGGTAAKLVRALAAVERLETPYHLAPDVARMFAAAGRAKGRTQGAAMLAVHEPLDVPRIEREVSPGYRILLRDTVTITRISAGNTVNVIPAHASADLDIRLLPDSSADAMLQRIAAAVGTEAKLEVLLRGEATPASSANTELYQVLTRVMQEAEPGSTVAPVVGAGTTDSRFFRARGVVAYGISPFKVNYYDADSVHGTDERIRSRFFAEGVQLMRSIVREFCAP